MMRFSGSAIALLGLVCSGCVAYTTTPPAGSPIGHTAPSKVSSESIFHYEKSEIPYKNRVLDAEETSLYRVRNVRFPSIGDNGQPDSLVTGMYYESKLPGPKPIVIVLPIWGAAEYPPKVMTGLIKKKSQGRMNVLHIIGENFILDWEGLYSASDEEAFLDAWHRSARREWTTIMDIRRTIDWAEQRSEVDPDRIGLMAFSHGAMLLAAAVVQDPRPVATALVMGGGYPHQLVGRCPSRRCGKVRDKALEDFGWSSEELEDRLEPIFRSLDAASYPGRIDPSRVLVVEAAKDKCMSEAGREAMWEALGRPRRVQLDNGHVEAFLAMTPLKRNWLRGQIWQFFETSLMSPETTYSATANLTQ